MALAYPPFAAVEQIRKAAISSPPLKEGSKGPGVAVLQGGLIDLGYKFSVSTFKSGHPDGVYGAETKKIIAQFQSDAKLAVKDGITGKKTIAALDALLAAKKAGKVTPPSAPKAVKPILPSNKNYTLGVSTPTIRKDPGAGQFNSKPMEVSMWALRQAILEILPPRSGSAALIIGPHAAIHMKHYLDQSGTKLRLDAESMVTSGPTAKARFRDEVSQARKFVETLPPGTHKISSKTVEGAYNYKEESWDWFYAVGGYISWGEGTAVVTKGPSGRSYELQFQYHVFDRYNWDKGKSVTIGPITVTDEFMAEFHRQGLAQEYDVAGIIKRVFQWREGEAIPEVQYQRGGGR